MADEPNRDVELLGSDPPGENAGPESRAKRLGRGGRVLTKGVTQLNPDE
jgi:hypothetical protein